ncbi:hypothetical protein VSDG_06671 [Cytospora chrysosperma]|uniref:Uncharacterized protein n=1 Tax=Cytospora chrysosperma TaxID=252740 RepID=A0A423VN88_CYTCH|nr:hypothetical protein VSDG_06671 [Valsa sordida]
MSQNRNRTRTWGLNHLDAWVDPTLIALASRTVAHVSIEFLETNGVKPHVVYNLKVNAMPQQSDLRYKGVRLSMECCQSFMRLYDFRVVQGHGGGLGVESSYENFDLIPRHTELGTGDDYWFFDIIDKNFVRIRIGNVMKIRINPMPMHRGIFQDQNLTRMETFGVNAQHSFRLNYVARGQPTPVPPRDQDSS